MTQTKWGIKKKLVKGSKYQVKIDSDIFGNFPAPMECPVCHKTEYYNTHSVRAGEELTMIYFVCLNCGNKEAEPFD